MPPPPRYRWSRRTLLLSGVLIGAGVLIRLGWGWQLQRQHARQIADIRQRGWPASVEDLPFEPIDDSQNAWTLQRQAAAAHVPGVDSPRNSVLEYPDGPPWSSAWVKAAAASEQANAGVFKLMRQARSRPRGQLLSEPLQEKNLLNFGISRLSDAHQIANTVTDGATYAHINGNDAEAIERLLDVLHLAKSIYNDDRLVSHLVAGGIDAMAAHAAQAIGPGLHLGAPATRPVISAAKPEQIREVIAVLLDESIMTARAVPMSMLEPVFAETWLTTLSEATWFTRPLSTRAIIDGRAGSVRMATALQLPNNAEAQKSLSPVEPVDLRPFFGGRPRKPVIPRYSRWYSFEVGSPSRAVQLHFQILAERRLTAVSLAIQLYRADHNAPPATLDDLVPRYLAAIPRDPFAGDGRAIGYTFIKNGAPTGGDRALVYFDLPGTENFDLPPTPVYDWQMRGRKKVRQYRDVIRWIASPAKTVDDDPDKAGAPGDQPQPEDGIDRE